MRQAARRDQDVELASAVTMPLVSEVVTEHEWSGYIARHPDATAYHAWRWREVFERAFGHRPVYLAAKEGDVITGVLPLVQFNHRLFGRFLVSLPFVNYGGVLASNERAAEALIDRATELARTSKAAHLELRHRHRRFPHLQAKSHKVTMLLPLPSTIEPLWESIDKKVRNQIRKAQKSDLTVQVGGFELVGEFYQVFCRNRRDLGTPVYGRGFFEEILRQFPDSTRVFIVRHGARPVAGGVSVAHGTTFELPWASSLREYRQQCPNYLLYWTILQYAVEQGCHRFDFGRSTPDDGPYNFKKQWGARPVPLCWEYQLISAAALPDRSPKNPKLQTAIAVWQRLPLWFTTLVGPQVARYLP